MGTSRRPLTVVATVARHVGAHTGLRTTMAWSPAKVRAVMPRPTWYSHSPSGSGSARPWPLRSDRASTLPISWLISAGAGTTPHHVVRLYTAGVRYYGLVHGGGR